MRIQTTALCFVTGTIAVSTMASILLISDAGAQNAVNAVNTIETVHRSTADDSTLVLDSIDCVVQPSEIADLGVGVPGLLETVYVQRSDYVEAGQLLAELESDVEKASLALAERISGITTAQELRQLNAAFGVRTLQRNEALFQKSTISRQTLDQVKTESLIAGLQVRQEDENLEIARLEAARAQAALDRRAIRSPFEGAVTERYKTAGEYIADEPVLQIARLDPLRIEVIVPLTHLNQVESGMTAEVTLSVPGFENERYEAKVQRVDPVADAASGTYGVWLELPNPELKIPAGVRCNLDISGS